MKRSHLLPAFVVLFLLLAASVTAAPNNHPDRPSAPATSGISHYAPGSLHGQSTDIAMITSVQCPVCSGPVLVDTQKLFQGATFTCHTCGAILGLYGEVDRKTNGPNGQPDNTPGQPN